jgi:hypothetical protein
VVVKKGTEISTDGKYVYGMEGGGWMREMNGVDWMGWMGGWMVRWLG